MNEQYPNENPLSIPVDKVCASATLDTLKVGPVPTGRLWRIHNIAIQNVDHGATDVKVYLEGMGDKFYLFQKTTLAAAVVYSDNGAYYIPEGKTLCFDFEGATLTDRLKVFVNGCEIERMEAPAASPAPAPAQGA